MNRVVVCEECGLMFWTTSHRALRCKRCAQTVLTRRWRNAHREAFRAYRRQAYHRKALQPQNGG